MFYGWVRKHKCACVHRWVTKQKCAYMGGLKNENVRTWVDLSRKCVVWVGGSTNHLDHHVYPPKYEVPPLPGITQG